MMRSVDDPRVGLGQIVRTFLRLGAVGFGGPAAHIALMQEELVERRRWIDRERFLEALGAANLVPGPTSSQLAVHAGYLLRGQPGALLAGLAFALPSVLLMIGLSAAYFAAGERPLLDDLFAGLQPVVIAVLVVTLWRLRSAVTGWLHAGLAVAAAALTVATPSLGPAWLLAAGVVALGASRPRPRLAREETGAAAVLTLAWVFLKTGALLFGGGYVLIPLLEPEVLAHGWLSRAEFLDGIALGQATPGPIVTTSAFVGYAVAGVGGALIATAAVYLPSFLAVMAGTGPFLRAFRSRPAVRAFVGGVTAAALGAIAAAGILLGEVALASPLRAAIGAAAAIALLRRVPIWVVLPAGALVGLAAGAGG